MIMMTSWIHLGEEGETFEVLLNLLLLCALLTYFLMGVEYLVFHYKFPAAPRPWKSPIGIYGGIVVTIICAVTILVDLVTTNVFRLAGIVFLIKFAMSGGLYVVVVS
jgi:ethanolamine permease